MAAAMRGQWQQEDAAERPARLQLQRGCHNVARKGGSLKLRELYLRPGATLLVPLSNTVLGTAGAGLSSSSTAADFWGAGGAKSALPSVVHVAPDAGAIANFLDLLEKLADVQRREGLGSRVVLLLLHSALRAAGDAMTQRARGRLQKLLQGCEALLLFDDFCSETCTPAAAAAGAVQATDEQLEQQRQQQRQQQFTGACCWCLPHLQAGPGASTPTLCVTSQEPLAYSSDLATIPASNGTVDAMDWEDFINRHFRDGTAAARAAASELDEVRLQCLAAVQAEQAAAAPALAGSDTDAAAAAEQEEATVGGGTLSEGVLNVFRHNPREATVQVRSASGRSETVLLSGRDAQGRALHGDTVALRLLPRGCWRAPEGSRRLTVGTALADDDADADTGGGDGSNAPGAGAKGERGSKFKVEVGGDVMPTGEVVRVVRAGRRRFVATIPAEEASRGGESGVLAVPMDPRLPKLRLRTHQLVLLMGCRLLVEVDAWEEGSRWPAGHYVRTLGRVGDVGTEVAALLVEANAAFGPFSALALAELPHVPVAPHEPQAPPSAEQQPAGESAAEQERAWRDSGWQVPAEEVAQREDLRSECRVFSVDPPGCQDIDDAMHVRELPPLPPPKAWKGRGGGAADTSPKVVRRLQVGVHIADVTHFVAHGGALDREARARATTTYLPHRRFDMLPALLSGDVCSLHGGRDRCAVSVLWEVEQLDDGRAGDSELFRLQELENGDVRARFARSVIHSVAAMTYDQAHTLIHKGALTNQPHVPPGQAGAPVPPHLHAPLGADLHLLTLLTRWLKSRRAASGAIDLTRSEGELKFQLDARTGLPVAVTAKSELEINHTIAELMILANAAVAQATLRAFPRAALLRTHAPVAAARLGELSAVAAAAGVDAALEQAVAAARGGEAVASLLKSLAIRGMSEALYVCTGALGEHAGEGGEGGGLAHYGLGIGAYTHFTSPIRRYADIIVHRLLLATMGQGYTSVTPPPPQPNDTKPTEPAWDAAGVAIPASLAPSVLPGAQESLSVAQMPRGALTPVVPEPLGAAAAAAALDDLEGDDLLDALLGGDDGDAGASVVGDGHKVSSGADVGSAGAGSGGSVWAGGKLQLVVAGEAATEAQAAEEQEEVEAGGEVLAAGERCERGAPFGTQELAQVCLHLNDRTRTAKRLSYECQELFLRLHFMNTVRVVDAIVLSLKANGFMAYVPAFDTKGPVFLADKSGVVQLDPALLRLPAGTGGDPAQGFTMMPGCRSLPDARLTLSETSLPANRTPATPAAPAGAELRVEAPSARPLLLSPMMVVRLQVTCDVQPHKSRLPDLRFALAGMGARAGAATNGARLTDFASKRAPPPAVAQQCTPATATAPAEQVSSDYDGLERLQPALGAPPTCIGGGGTAGPLQEAAAAAAAAEVAAARRRKRASGGDGGTSSARGRISFGGFKTEVTAQASVLLEYQDVAFGGGGGALGGSGWQAVAGGEAAAYGGGGGAAGGLGQRLGQWDDSAERAAQRDATSRIQREAAKRRQYKRPNN